MKHTDKFLPAPKEPPRVEKPSSAAVSAGAFVFPGPRDRVTINGMTGSGKTTFAMWLFAEAADFDRKPWIIVDFKQADFGDFEDAGVFNVISLARLPDEPGVYIVKPETSEIRRTIDFLWKVYQRGKTGLFLDEATMIPDLRGEANTGGPFQSILSQGRSKEIPVYTLAQRPVSVNKMIYSEADYISVFKLTRRDDWEKIAREITEDSLDYERRWAQPSTLPAHQSLWFDKRQNRTFLLKRSPPLGYSLDKIAERLEIHERRRTI